MQPLLHLKNSLLELPRLGKRFIALMVDVAFCVLTIWLALCLRLETWVPLHTVPIWVIACSVVLAIPIFIRFGLYSAVFRYAGWYAIGSIVRSLALYGLLFALIFSAIGFAGIPRSLGILQPMLLFFAIASSRMIVRYWLGDLYATRLSKQALPGILIYGAGQAGRQIAAALQRSTQHRLAGFIDDDPNLKHQRIDDQTIYSPDELAQVIQKNTIDTVLITIPSLSQQRLIDILSHLEQFRLRVRTLPKLDDLTIGHLTLNDLRDIQVEDLLSRDTVAAIPELLNRDIYHKTVMITGAGGSIGQELCRQVLQQQPSHLILFEISEYSLYQIHQELHNLQSNTQLLPIIGSVQDSKHLDKIIKKWAPHIIYHAAAYKHVPLVEHNVCAALKNNIWGTLTCAQVAILNHVPRFVLISTDKAVRPTNIMGASKRLAEMVLQALSDTRHTTCFSMVRFGNVLGSSGSVVPLFKKQIQQGGPITVTDKEITRYFMTIPEAAQLVIQAGAMASGGEVFLLEMGKPVKIYDLALRMIHLSGLSIKSHDHPQGDIEIILTGLRPGEKLYEELLINQQAHTTAHPRISKAHENFIPWDTLQVTLNQLSELLDNNDVERIRFILTQSVNGYQAHPSIVDWLYTTDPITPHDTTTHA